VPAAAEPQSATPQAAAAQPAAKVEPSPPQTTAAEPAKAAPARPAAAAGSTKPVGVVKGPVPPLGARPGGTWGSKDVPLERSRPSAALVVGAVLAALMVFLLVQVVDNLRSPGRGTSQVAGPTLPTSASHPPATGTAGATAPATTPTTVPSPTTTTVTPPQSGVAVALSLIGDSWVSVRDASGHEMFSGLLGKGDSRRFSDGKLLHLTLGNAGAVRLTVNGKSIGSAGGNGQVVRLNFGPKDPA
jgi:hypothetical protein